MEPNDTKPPDGITRDLHIRRHHLPHWQMGGSIYFVTFRSRCGDLPESARRIVVQTLLHNHTKRYDLLLAVVMPDHVHILLCPRQKTPGIWFDLGEIMKGIKGTSARKINKLMGRKGSIWAEESCDRMIRSEDEYIEKWKYMEHNPVKSGLANDPREYEFIVRPDLAGESGEVRDKSVPPTD